MLRNIRKAKARMEKEIGRTPSLPELAHYMTIPLDKLRLYTDSSRTVLSLEVPLNRSTQTRSSTLEEDKRTLGEKIACTEEPSVEDDATYDALRTDIRLAIDSLGNDKERDVLIARFGLEDGTPKTLEETAKRLGLSRDRVRMVEARALNKLRHPQRNYKLKVYVNGGGTSSSQGGHSVEWREGHPSWEMGSSATSTNTTHGSSSKAMTSTIDHWERSSSRSSSSIFNQATNKRKVHGIKSLWTDERDTLSKFSPETIWSV
jgi:RNA polymerase sigma factor (sigma-70 family)